MKVPDKTYASTQLPYARARSCPTAAGASIGAQMSLSVASPESDHLLLFWKGPK